jgi:cytochrome c-type biogenesis protein
MSNGSEVSIIMSFTAGVLTFLSPCILPLFPSYITYITGRSFEELKGGQAPISIRKLTALHSLFFILGFSIIFVLLGITFSYLGSFFGIRKIWLERVGGTLIILFGLHISGIFNLGFLNVEKRVVLNKRKVGYFGSFLVGMAFSVGWTPCVGPILSSILIYASTIESLPRSIALLCFYSLGLGVPFFIAGIAVNQFLFIFNRFKNFMKFIPIVTGVFLIFIGALLFFGRFSWLSGVFSA